MVSKSRKKTMIALWVVLGLVVLFGLTLLFTVDDWSRDLTSNVATTSASASDPRLRPLEMSATADEVAEALHAFIAANPHWEWQDAKASRQPPWRLVRATAIMRFKDDVTLEYVVDQEQAVLQARSESRVGKGDLGQNPRNLRELLGFLEKELPAAPVEGE